MLIKICGITRLDDALAAAEAGATAVGFNFWRPGKRYIAPQRAAEVAKALPPAIRKVGVFVDESPATVLEIASGVSLDVFQFHGAETPEYLRTFEAHVNWKAIRVRPGWNPAAVAAYAGVEALLLDSPGNGETFDWTLAAAAKSWGRVILAGGLTPANVGDAIRAVHPWGVDVASGVESSPGVKDHAKMREFVRKAKQEQKESA
jgi:phosphoribosylanthranilate isomerase